MARVVAGRLMSDLEAEFRRRARRDPTDFDRYVLWNAGPAYYAQIGYSRARVSRVVRERAVRFANLCETLPKETPVMVSTRPAPKPAMTVQTNAAPAVVFSLEPRPAQLEFPAFSLQANLPAEASPTRRGAVPAHTTAKPPSGIVAATILDGK